MGCGGLECRGCTDLYLRFVSYLELESLFGDGFIGRGWALKSVLCGGAQSFSNGSLLGAMSELFCCGYRCQQCRAL
ncbi:hypothetical protein D3C80_1604810 [compost metagenome]